MPGHHHHSFDDASVEFDEDFVRSATIHEPSAQARLRAFQSDAGGADAVAGSVRESRTAATWPPPRVVRLPTRVPRVLGGTAGRFFATHPIMCRLAAVVATAGVTLGILALTR